MVIWGLSKQSNNFPEFKFVAVNRKNRCKGLFTFVATHFRSRAIQLGGNDWKLDVNTLVWGRDLNKSCLPNDFPLDLKLGSNKCKQTLTDSVNFINF